MATLMRTYITYCANDFGKQYSVQQLSRNPVRLAYVQKNLRHHHHDAFENTTRYDAFVMMLCTFRMFSIRCCCQAIKLLSP